MARSATTAAAAETSHEALWRKIQRLSAQDVAALLALVDYLLTVPRP